MSERGKKLRVLMLRLVFASAKSDFEAQFSVNLFTKLQTEFQTHKADWHEALHSTELENKQSMRKCYLTQFVAVGRKGYV